MCVRGVVCSGGGSGGSTPPAGLSLATTTLPGKYGLWVIVKKQRVSRSLLFTMIHLHSFLYLEQAMEVKHCQSDSLHMMFLYNYCLCKSLV